MGQALSQAKAQRPVGRQLSITPRRVGRFLAALQGGNYLNTAAAYAGTSLPTYRNWVAIGERETENYRLANPDSDPEVVVMDWLELHPFIRGFHEDSPAFDAAPPEGFDPVYWLCVIFSFSLTKAAAEAEVQALAQIQLAARQPQHWQAAMTFLERRHPDRWRRQDRTVVEGVEGGAPITVQSVTTDALVEKIEQLRMEAEAKAARSQPDS